MKTETLITIFGIIISFSAFILMCLVIYQHGMEVGRDLGRIDGFNEGFSEGRIEGIRKAIQANLTSNMYPDGNYPADIEIIDIITPSNPVYIPDGAVLDKTPLGVEIKEGVMYVTATFTNNLSK